MGAKKPLSDFFIELGQDCSLDDFVRKHPDPVLITVNKVVRAESTKTVVRVSSTEMLNPWKDILVYLVGDYGSHPFKGTFYCIGRHDPTNDVVINDQSVSHTHALLSHDRPSNQWFIKDANSTNGTFVHGENLLEQKVEGDNKQPLANGMYIRLGDATVQFYLPPGFYDYLGLQRKIFERGGKL